MSLGFGFGFPKRVSSGGSGAFSQLGPTLDLVFAGQPTTGDPSQLYSLDMNYLAQTYSVGAMYSVWAGGQMVPANFQDIITFQRTSPGWYYNSSGYLTQSGINNYLIYSNQFDNVAWTKSNSFVQTNTWAWSQDFDNATWNPTLLTVDPNKVAAPDGTQTADILIATASTGTHFVIQGTSGLTGIPLTMSVYAKAGTNNFLQVFHGALGINYANFDLATGSVGDVGAGFTSATMTPAGNGWYRCIVTLTPTATSAFRIVIASSATAPYNNSWTTTGTESVYLWGAQLVQGSVPGDYRATTSTALPIFYLGPHGVLDAEKLCESASNSTHSLLQVITTVAAPYTFSVYAKQPSDGAARRYFLLYHSQSNTGWVFDLQTGALGVGGTTGVSAPVAYSIISIGNGWYRCQITVNATAAANTFAAYTVDNNGSAGSVYNGNGSSGIYISDAQLELGSAATSYWPTTNSVYYAPRFDYDPVTLQPKGLLIEEARTNLLLQSNDFQTSWTQANITRTLNSTLSPDGNINGVKLAATAALGTVVQQAATVAATSATGSVYAKQGTGANVGNTFIVRNATTATILVAGTLDYSTGVFTYSTGSTGVVVTNAGNGWWRIAITATTGITSGDSVNLYVGWGGAVATAGDFLYAYGAQLEAGAFATSYIPTTTAAVPRAGDVANINTLTPWYNNLAGTWVANFQTTWSGNAEQSRWILAADLNGSKRMLYIGSGSSAVSTFDGASPLAAPGSITGIATKAASTYTATTRSIGANGSAVFSGALAAGFAATSSINIGNQPNQQPCGWISRVTYYPRALSNTELQTITT